MVPTPGGARLSDTQIVQLLAQLHHGVGVMHSRQKYAGRTAMLLLAAVLTTAGCGGATAAAPSPDRSMTVGPTPDTAIECGQPFQPPTGGGLALTGRFPATAPTGGKVTGTVEVVSQVAIRGVVPPQADVFLVQDGRVATVPMAQDAMGIRWDLSPGQVERLPGEAT